MAPEDANVPLNKTIYRKKPSIPSVSHDNRTSANSEARPAQQVFLIAPSSDQDFHVQRTAIKIEIQQSLTCHHRSSQVKQDNLFRRIRKYTF